MVFPNNHGKASGERDERREVEIAQRLSIPSFILLFF